MCIRDRLSLDTPTTPSLLIPPDTLETVIAQYDGAAAAGSALQASPTSVELAGVTELRNTAVAAAVDRPAAAAAGDYATSQRLATERRATKKREQTRERKAARTLGVITGTFVVCWLPFFILALVRPFCADRCHYPDLLVSVIGWLGYVNSLLNPVIYTVFNPDFRLAFRKILFGRYRAGGGGGGVDGGSTRGPTRWRSHNGGTRSSRTR